MNGFSWVGEQQKADRVTGHQTTRVTDLESGGSPTNKQGKDKNTNRKPMKYEEFSEGETRMAKMATKDGQGSSQQSGTGLRLCSVLQQVPRRLVRGTSHALPS